MRTLLKPTSKVLLAAMVGIAASLASGPSADAAVAISYYTTGMFTLSATNYGPDGNGDAAVSLSTTPTGTATLTYNAIRTSNPVTYSDQDVTDNQLNLSTSFITLSDLGTFTMPVLASGKTLTAPSGLTFTLSVFQTVPGVDSGTLVGTFAGKVTGSTVQGFNISFPANSSIGPLPSSGLPNVTYIIDKDGSYDPTGLSGANDKFTFSSTGVGGEFHAQLTGDLLYHYEPGGSGSSPVPLPAVASMGWAMFGLLGIGCAGYKLTRRKAIRA